MGGSDDALMGSKRGMKRGLAAEDVHEGQFNMEKAFKDLGAYVEDHPEFITAVVFWVITGNILLLTGLVLFLYSEIKMVCIVRSQETTLSYYETQELGSKEDVGVLTDSQRSSIAARPYLTFIATVLFFGGVLLAMIPLCDVLHLLGMPTGVTCIYIIVFEALGVALILHFFVLGAVWSCTRPWASLVLITLALCGLVLCPTGNVLLMLLFFFLAFSVYMSYFSWYPDYLTQQHHSIPDWVQSLGSFEVTLDDYKWAAAGRVITSTAWQEAAEAVSGSAPDDADADKDE